MKKNQHKERKKIVIFTSGRSDFGLLKQLIKKIENDNYFDLHLIIGAAHKSKTFGKTVNEIDKIKIKKKSLLNFNYNKSGKKNTIRYFQKTN